MPDTARVNGRGVCPVCGTPVLSGVRCQWGELPGPTYELGDSATWLRNADGTIRDPFRLGRDVEGRWRWNCGDPRYADVILFDVLFDADVFTQNCCCPSCNTRIAGGIAIVRAGRFREVRALTGPDVDAILGRSRGKADTVIIRDDGTYWPREDWYDHSVEYMG